MTTKPQRLLPLPDTPEREPDDMTSAQHLSENGNLHHLAQYLGNPDNTIVSGERYIVPTPGTPANQRIAPRPAHLVQRQPGALPPRQRLRHLPAGQTARPGLGDSLQENRQTGRGEQADQVRGTGNTRVLAVR